MSDPAETRPAGLIDWIVWAVKFIVALCLCYLAFFFSAVVFKAFF